MQLSQLLTSSGDAVLSAPQVEGLHTTNLQYKGLTVKSAQLISNTRTHRQTELSLVADSFKIHVCCYYLYHMSPYDVVQMVCCSHHNM